MEFFIAEGGSCSFDVESIDNIKVPLRYKHLVKRWVPKDLPQVNTDFCLDKRIYCISPSSLHGLGLFSMDVIKVFYGGITELMEYVRAFYNYRDWMKLVQYTRGMRIYGVAANYIQLRDNDRNKGGSMYIDGRPKASRNIVGFINSTRPRRTNNQPNCIFEGRERNCVFVCAIKSITAGEELLIDYNLNRIHTDIFIMGAVI
jgi:hypothetical protein